MVNQPPLLQKERKKRKKAMGSVPKALLSAVLLAVLFSLVCSTEAAVSYDGRAITINGQRRILISGSIHYPRSSPEMWPDLIQKAKAGGLDVIDTYVFWDGHEPSLGIYNFEGRYDLVKFIKLVRQAGLYVHLRIGPYITAEWNYGGIPVWLKFIRGIQFRTNNEPYKAAMQRFVEKIVNVMKYERLFEPQGGPVILTQIENEYGNFERVIGAPGRAYTNWFSQMAVGQNTGVPWVMCKQDDAPDPIINTCNGFYCDSFTPNKPYKPKMWTEVWSGWFTEFGGAVPFRPVEDLAFAVAKFVQNNGSFFNYYMYHGGTNFGRTASAFMTTSYDYDAPIDEYGLVNSPKWGHLRDLHNAIKRCEPALVSSSAAVTWLNKYQEAHIFRSNSGACAAFLSNNDRTYSAKVTFQNKQYNLPPWSVSILPDCKNEVFNTATVRAPRIHMKMLPVGGRFSWQSFIEQPPSAGDRDTFTKSGLQDQLSLTRDSSDYLWYLTNLNIAPNERFLKTEQFPILTVASASHVLHVFINGQLSGTVYGSLDKQRITFRGGIKLKAGMNKIALLSVAMGLPSYGWRLETWTAGIFGPVTLTGMNSGTWDLTKQIWSYKVDVKGQSLGLHSVNGSSSVEWLQGASLAQKQPLTWYKTTFNAPRGNDPLALDMGSMGKGQIWVNGQNIGRHWAANIATGNCGNCNYAGIFNPKKCNSNCGQPTQKWYHVPRSWLKPTGNQLVVFEEQGGNPYWISLVRRTAFTKDSTNITTSTSSQGSHI